MFLDKELAAAKDRQEIELAAQRATLQEQRTHIDILDTALGNAQRNVVRLEDEVNFILNFDAHTDCSDIAIEGFPLIHLASKVLTYI